jgi:hypothetical protein
MDREIIIAETIVDMFEKVDELYGMFDTSEVIDFLEIYAEHIGRKDIADMMRKHR